MSCEWGKTDGIAIKYSSQVASISIFSLGLPIFLYELKDNPILMVLQWIGRSYPHQVLREIDCNRRLSGLEHLASFWNVSGLSTRLNFDFFFLFKILQKFRHFIFLIFLKFWQMLNSYLIIFKHFQSKFEVPAVLGKLIFPISATVLTDFKSHY